MDDFAERGGQDTETRCRGEGRTTPSALQPEYRVSVIVPAFNSVLEIGRTLRSLKNQTVSPFEVIVVVDGSSDGTGTVAAQFSGVRVVTRATQGGAGAARADGARLATGNILAFLDSDCEAPADWVERIVTEMNGNPDFAGISGVYVHEEANTLPALAYKLEQDYSWRFFAGIDPGKPPMVGGNMAFRAPSWRDARSGRELLYFRNVASGEDTILADDIRKRHRTRFLPDLSVRHQPKESLGSYLRMQFLRGWSRGTIIFNRLLSENDVAVAGYGGLPLFLGSLALGAAFIPLLGALLFPQAWGPLTAAGLALLAVHLGLSRRFFAFVHDSESRPQGRPVSLWQDIGLRFLLLARSVCWCLGAAKALGQRARAGWALGWNVVLSILHFWMPGRISKLFYFVTSKCNARCSFCFNLHNVEDWKRRAESELTLEEVEAFTRKLGRMPYVTFSGGEPFTRKDLTDVVKAFHRNARTQWVTIPTNAALTKRTLADVGKILVECPGLFLTIQISVDSLHADHDRSRKISGGFEGLLRTLEGLAVYRRDFPNLQIHLNTPFSADTRERIGEIEAFFQESFEFDQHRFYLIRDARVLITPDEPGLVRDYLGFLIDHERREGRKGMSRLWSRAVRALMSITYADIWRIKTEQAYLRPCHAVQKFITLYDDGNVVPCEVLENELLGNIRNHGYDFYAMKRRLDLDRYHRREIIETKCSCDWPCAIPLNMLYDVRSWLRIAAAWTKPLAVLPALGTGNRERKGRAEHPVS